MKPDAIPLYNNEPILDEKPRPAFRISPEEVVDSIKQQFTHKELALRELGQNSQDADATTIRVDYRYEDGCMVLEFLDNGLGMNLKTIKENYLRLFDSSKESQPEKVGKWSLGRLSLLCYRPKLVEVFTLCYGNPGYKVVIEENFSGKLYEVDAGAMESIIKNPHGTLVRMTVRVDSAEEFVKMATQANESMEKELCWIKPELTVAKPKLTEGNLEFANVRINKEMMVPGRYSSVFTVKMASGGEEVHCSIGLESKDGKGLAPITLCTGKIPIERPLGLPWTVGKEFFFRGMHIVLDSFSFETNIGRNVVYRATPFVKEFMQKFFEKIILGKFVATMARLFSQPAFRSHEYDEAVRLMLCDVCIKSSEYGYKIPEEVLKAPFIPSYVSYRPYSLEELDKSKAHIYVTPERPTMLTLRDMDERRSDILCICTADLVWDFRNFLEKRYGQRLHPKENSLVVEENNIELLDITKKLRKRLFTERFLVRSIFEGLTGNYQQYSDVAVGYFRTYNGRTETRVPTMFHKQSERVYLNYNNPHIQNLLGLILGEDGTYADVAAHFLIREILFDPDLKYTISQREQLLLSDIITRFSDEAPDGLLETNGSDDDFGELLEEFAKFFECSDVLSI